MESEGDDGAIAVGGAPHGFALHLSFLWGRFMGISGMMGRKPMEG